jgi:hypothetical protein
MKPLPVEAKQARIDVRKELPEATRSLRTVGLRPEERRTAVPGSSVSEALLGSKERHRPGTKTVRPSV